MSGRMEDLLHLQALLGDGFKVAEAVGEVDGRPAPVMGLAGETARGRVTIAPTGDGVGAYRVRLECADGTRATDVASTGDIEVDAVMLALGLGLA